MSDDQYDGDEFKTAYERLMDERDKARAENDILRGIASKIMPCHYCGVDAIAKCPRGFPGCALMDDVICAEERMAEELMKASAELQAFRDGLAMEVATPTVRECREENQKLRAELAEANRVSNNWSQMYIRAQRVAEACDALCEAMAINNTISVVERHRRAEALDKALAQWKAT